MSRRGTDPFTAMSRVTVSAGINEQILRILNSGDHNSIEFKTITAPYIMAALQQLYLSALPDTYNKIPKLVKLLNMLEAANKVVTLPKDTFFQDDDGGGDDDDEDEGEGDD